MAITSLILALSTTISGGSTVAEANRLELIKYKSEQLIEFAAESYDYTNFLNLFDIQRESLLKQSLLNFNSENELLDNEHIFALQEHLLYNDPNYIEFENIDTMFLKDDVTPSIIENTRVIKTSLTESVKYSPINNELIANNVVINQQYTNILISSVTDGGGNSQGNLEETQPNGPLPIYNVNEANCSYKINENFTDHIFIGLIFSKELCMSVYNVFSFFINDIFLNEAFSGVEQIVRIFSSITLSSPLAPVVLSIIEYIKGFWSTFISAFATGNIVGIITGIIISFFAFMCITLLIRVIISGYFHKGYIIGWNVYNLFDWRWVDEYIE